MKTNNRAPFWDFDTHLFWEGFRQLRVVGIVSLVILCLAAVLIPIGNALSTPIYLPEEGPQRYLVSLLEMHPLVMAPMYTLALLMPLMAFSFLNKRHTSDFYHALPTSRAGVFVSFYAAVLAWILIVIVVSTAVSLVTCLCLPKLYQIAWNTILPLLCASLAGALMVAGCVTFAMCITGTLLTNLLVAAMLFFGPRLLMWYVSNLIHDGVNILPNVGSMPILDVSYNIPLGMFGDVNIASNWSGILYSSVVGILYFIGALAVFRVRRAEAADQPAATPLLQTVYRVFLTFIVTLLPMWLILAAVNDNDMLSIAEAFWVMVLYIVALLTFCIYELITTKKPKLLLKAAPTFLIVLLADVLLVAGILLGQKGILAFRPTPQQIQSVSLAVNRYEYSNRTYFVEAAGDVRITNEKVIELISKHLSDAARLNDPTADYNADEWSYFNVTVRTRGAVKTRRLQLTPEECLKIYEQLEDNAAYNEVYTLPALTHSMRVDISGLTDAQATEVYERMREDISALPFTERQSLLENTHDDKTGLGVTAELQLSCKGKTHLLSFPLMPEYYPNAYNAYLGYLFENQTEQREKILYWLPSLKDREMDFIMTVTDRNSSYQRSIEIVHPITEEQANLFLTELLPHISNEPYDKDDVLVRIDLEMKKINTNHEAPTEYFTWDAYFAVPQNFTYGEAFMQFAHQMDMIGIETSEEMW